MVEHLFFFQIENFTEVLKKINFLKKVFEYIKFNNYDLKKIFVNLKQKDQITSTILN